ncbi:MAG: hypothetical protein AAF750_05570 [Planctomycetota bacterium]
MNGEIAQCVAFTCHAKAFITGFSTNVPDLDHSTTRFCNQVSFQKTYKPLFRKQKQRILAETTAQWFDLLRRRKARRLVLHRIAGNEPGFSDRMLAGLTGGGGTWLIEDQSSLVPTLWIPRWTVSRKGATDNRIWSVDYFEYEGHIPTSRKTRDVHTASQKLEQALSAVIDFCVAQNNPSDFQDSFTTAKNTLNQGDLNGYHQDLAPEDWLPEAAQRLLDACQSSWVFGGMGSWNDMSFNGNAQMEYERVSENLYNAVCEAIQASVNHDIPE